MATRTIVLEVDDDDFDAIQRVIAQAQQVDIAGGFDLPDGEGNLVGRRLAEICRGYEDLMVWSTMILDQRDADE